MSAEENAALLLGRLDQLTAEVQTAVDALLNQAAELGRVRREIAVARSAVAEMAASGNSHKKHEKTERRTA